MLPQLEGTYLANPIQLALEEVDGKVYESGVLVKTNKIPQIVIEFQCHTFFNGDGWVGVEGDRRITGRFRLLKNDLTVNEFSCQSIMDALELKEFDIPKIVGTDWSQYEVQIVVANEEFESQDGQMRRSWKVKYLNHRDFAGRQLASDPGVVQSVAAKYGSLLKTKVKPQAPAKTGAPGKAAAAPSTNARQAASPTNLADAMKQAKAAAWNELKSKMAGATKDEQAAEWGRTVKGYSGGKAVAEITLAEWSDIHNKIAEYGIYKEPAPVTVPPDDTPPEGGADDTGAIKDDDIPF